jgi:hypothetical protein
MSQPERINFNGLRCDEAHPDFIRGFFEESFARKTFNPLEDSTATENLKDQIENWRLQGNTIIFTCGVYDLFHANHRTYLLHAKIAAAAYVWEGSVATGDSLPHWQDLAASTRTNFTKDLLDADLLKLIVSVDGNMSVADRKGFSAEKGNTVRPVYDWTSRARDVLSAGYELEEGKAKLIADAVTVHDNIQPELSKTPHCGVIEMADFIKPDVWSVFIESQDIIDALHTTHKEKFRDIEPILLPAHGFYHDKLLNGEIHSTTILGRVARSGSLNGNNKH